MAYAVSKWSKNNEINRYERYGFFSRKGRNSNYAIPIGEFVPSTQKANDLAAQLRYFRLDCRRIARSKDATSALVSAIFQLEKELIKLASGNGSYLNCLIQIGVLEREISYSSILDIDRIALGASTCLQVSREFKRGYLETLPPHYGIGAICQWGKTKDDEEIGGQ